MRGTAINNDECSVCLMKSALLAQELTGSYDCIVRTYDIGDAQSVSVFALCFLLTFYCINIPVT